MQLELRGIQKSFNEKRVLENINFTAKTGSALGLLGRNGAGKTTTIRIIMGIFPPDDGSITIDGQRVSAAGKTFGYLPEERGLYPKQVIISQIIYIGMLRGMSRHDATAAAQSWLSRLQMSEYRDKKLNTLSKGNQQKIQLAAALVNDPDIVILDEPFSGLDPVNAQMLKDIVTELVQREKIVLFSSHQMNYVEQFCDSIAMLGQGRIVLEGNLRQIKRSYDRRKILIIPEDNPGGIELYALLQKQVREGLLKSVSSKNDGLIVHLHAAPDREKLLLTLAQQKVPVARFEVLEPTLEEIFVEKAGEQNEAV